MKNVCGRERERKATGQGCVLEFCSNSTCPIVETGRTIRTLTMRSPIYDIRNIHYAALDVVIEISKN
jgi:hypothetical protein